MDTVIDTSLNSPVNVSSTLSNSPGSSPEQYAYLAPMYRPDAARSNEERIEIIKKGIVIEHAAFTAAMDYAHWILSQPDGTPGRGMLLMGEPGVGKSTFGEELALAGRGPIVMISAEGARSMREVYGRVLQALDGPVAKSMHTPDRELAVIRLFRALQIKAFVVDEIQDLAKGTQREHEHVLLSIKYLSNTARIPLICLGAPESERAFRVDKHLAKRLRPFRLPLWSLDQSFVDLVANVEATLPLRRASTLRNENALKCLIDISGGSLREIMERITCAAVRAILSGEECLTLQGLKDAASPPPRQVAGGGLDG